MSEQNVAAVRGVYERWSQGDFSASLEVLDPQVVFVVRTPIPEAGTYAGLDSLKEYTRSFLAPWASITIDAERYTEVGDNVLVAVRQRGRGGESGVTTEFRYFHVWYFRNGKAIRLESIQDRGEAIEAAGLAG